MGKQSKESSRSRKSAESAQLGKGKVTPAQVAFIVDCYLGDNNLSETRSAFHSEAPHLFSKSPPQESTKVLSLGELLDEYVCLKGQKLAVDKERGLLEQEKLRLQNLLKGMQDVMNAYNASATLNTPPALVSSSSQFPAGGKAPAKANNADSGHDNPSKLSAIPSSVHRNASNGTTVQGSTVSKCLFKQSTQSPTTNSSGPKTPPRASSSQSGKSISPQEISSTATSGNDFTPQQMVSPNCMIISSETIRVSPSKQLGYYSIERNRCISTLSPVKANMNSTKRDHVKGRLDFDASDLPSCSTKVPSPGGNSTSESDGEMFDLDLDALGMEFNLSELLVDFELDGQGNFSSPQQDKNSSPEPFSDSPNKSGEADMGANQISSHISSMFTEVLAKETGLSDPNTFTSMKSVTKRIEILSPVKAYGRSMDERKCN
ncbi:hypothetical protein DM860_002821 [Cuscuta australis]|uniref:LisH domain-containing protein n=1 Tax=Cuscuta australis TaxID=267555 RepID=A0A328D441_9ASTE|nr:hypothetical protein DM860_002821 [Cuscuta australis]